MENPEWQCIISEGSICSSCFCWYHVRFNQCWPWPETWIIKPDDIFDAKQTSFIKSTLDIFFYLPSFKKPALLSPLDFTNRSIPNKNLSFPQPSLHLPSLPYKRFTAFAFDPLPLPWRPTSRVERLLKRHRVKQQYSLEFFWSLIFNLMVSVILENWGLLALYVYTNDFQYQTLG